MTHKEGKKKFRRVHYIVDAVFQMRYVGFILLMISLAVAICSYTVYYSGMITIVDKLSNFYPQGRLVAMLNSVNVKILVNIIILIPVVVIIGIYMSHKIAGPIYRLERFLTDMAGGNLSSNIRFRKGDELTHLADKMNLALEALRVTLRSQKDGLDNIINHMDGHEDKDPVDIGQRFANIHKEIARLREGLDKYRL